MTKKEATARFIYGSNVMNSKIEYDNEGVIDYNKDDIGNAFCDNNCFACEMVCPYKEF